MRNGQALLEYALALAGLAAAAAVLGVLVSASVGFGVRTERLVSSECP